MIDLREALHANAYPGRVILLARTHGGDIVGGYALTGRSTSSRARRIEVTAQDELTVVPTGDGSFDALRHYACARANDNWTVLGNGAQVDEVFDRLGDRQPALALDGIGYEPDPPINTPRITAVVDRLTGTAWLGAARRGDGRRTSADIQVTTIRELAPGDAVLLSTYQSDGRTIATARTHHDLTTNAQGEDELLDELWAALDARYLVAATTFRPLTGVIGPIRHADPATAAPRSRT